MNLGRKLNLTPDGDWDNHFHFGYKIMWDTHYEDTGKWIHSMRMWPNIRTGAPPHLRFITSEVEWALQHDPQGKPI